MKYPATMYAKALVEVLAESESKTKSKDDQIAKNFLALVKRNGDEGGLKKILEEASRLSRDKSGIREVMIESARELTALQSKEIKHFLENSDVVIERINPELIAGVKITVNDELQFDGSLKTKLNRALGV